MHSGLNWKYLDVLVFAEGVEPEIPLPAHVFSDSKA